MPSPARPSLMRRSEERRREHRHTTRYTATLETARSGVMKVELADVSTHGCCIRAPDNDDRTDWLRQGTFVSIRLEDSSAPEAAKLEAVVRWVRGHTAGMEFLRPVPPGRLDWRELMDFGLEA
jgi:hypothetical protein